MKERSRFMAIILPGVLLWLAHCIAQGSLAPFSVNWPLMIVAFGAMVIVPAGLEVLRRQQVAAIEVRPVLLTGAWLFMVAGVILEQRSSAAAPWFYALPWLLVTLWIAWQAVSALLRGPRSVERAVMLSGPVMLAVGGAWYFADRTAMQPFGFDFLIVRLTAAHFHFAGFVLPIAAGLVLRHAPGRLMKAAAPGVVAGVPMVAAGITLTRMGSRVEVECVLALLFSLFALAIGIGQAALAWKKRTQPVTARALLFVSGVCLTAGMVLAMLYALRPWCPLPSLHLPRMWAWHGSLQAFGFALCGLIGWLRWRPA
jgi:hypothetical protein